ncbi:MAG TPA: NAD-dependent protein deacetylase [Candidatus Aquabacterium excrementipullorum]|nr:NAD-dependent protein deacetylase [Candidatus Aquabacterium excrementipullorum]
MSNSPADLAALRAALSVGPFVILTGAGLSTGSGIPAYRDAEGRWVHPMPVQHQAFLRDEAVRRRYWARSFVGWRRFGQARPNGGHTALAELERQGHVHTLITQNVDGLHLMAGSRSVIELHGALRHVVCLDCGQRHERVAVQVWLEALNPGFDPSIVEAAQTAPDGDAHLEDTAYAGFSVPSCPECGGVLKPDVVFYGDNVPRDRVAQALTSVEEAAGLLVVGSSLMVYSGYRFAERAHRLGKPVIAINQGVTRADALLAFKVEDDCVAILQALAAPT